MSEPFLGEVKIIGFNFAPPGWAFCDGQILPIEQNQSLYSLLGTTYGGDGETSFGLPDLRGRTPIHVNSRFADGQKGGQETVQLTQAEMPRHRHAYNATCEEATTDDPAGAILAPTATRQYRGTGTQTALNSSAVAATGGSQAHNNMQPYLTVNYVIALAGIFPSK